MGNIKMNYKRRIKEARSCIYSMIAHEKAPGEHTFSMCKCGREGCRSKCLICLNEDLDDLDRQWKKYVEDCR